MLSYFKFALECRTEIAKPSRSEATAASFCVVTAMVFRPTRVWTGYDFHELCYHGEKPSQTL
ncbi:hypothetical protein BT93_K0436 [Corymbia citriodora subsp. variegata]|nr:hypothetical protein BT93_K0436 [Corymbia citriodora subsp. variegata]